MTDYAEFIERRELPDDFDYGGVFGDRFACKECGAVVMQSHIEVHRAWHKEVIGRTKPDAGVVETG